MKLSELIVPLGDSYLAHYLTLHFHLEASVLTVNIILSSFKV